MPPPRILLYILRHDLRVRDNPVLTALAHGYFAAQPAPFTHLVPLYIFPAHQVEVSGFRSAAASSSPCPFPEARSSVAGFWRCGPHRARFLAESVWAVKRALEDVGSGLVMRVGMAGEVVKEVIEEFASAEDGAKVVGVWMAGEEGVEEKREERDVQRAGREMGVEVRVFGGAGEGYFVDECGFPTDSFSTSLALFVSFIFPGQGDLVR